MSKANVSGFADAPRVFSYIRFSTPEQAMGDSERRQVDAAREWAAKRGHKLDESLKPDKGISGFNGDHRKKGHLGTFLKMVQAGNVPKGSILVVENIDRLGREGVFTTLKEIFFTLFDYGVTIQTLAPEQAFDQKSVETGEVFLLIAHIIRARDESERKSHRGCQNWKQKKKRAHEDGCILTAKCPAWLTVVRDGTKRQFEVVPGAAETIRMMFELKLSGIGVRGICTKLNAGGGWTRANGFHASYLKKILQNRAVIGEHQPRKNVGGEFVPDGDVLTNYYPKIVEPDLFFAVQALFNTDCGNAGQTGKAQNLFVHLVKCAYCGGSMSFINCHSRTRPHQYLACDRARRGVGCARHPVRYDECEKLVLENCHRLQPDRVLPNPGEQAARCQLLRHSINGKHAESKGIEQQLENLTDQITRTQSQVMRDRYESKMEQLVEQQARIKLELDAATDELADAERGMESLEKWKQDLGSLLEALTADDADLRLRLRSHLRDLITKIEVFAVGHSTEHDEQSAPNSSSWRETVDGERIADFLYSVVDHVTGEFHEFVEHVVDRRLSKEGRFLRVHFKTGRVLTLVPPGSIASGMRLVRNGEALDRWEFVSPSIDRMWQEFRSIQLPNTTNVGSATGRPLPL